MKTTGKYKKVICEFESQKIENTTYKKIKTITFGRDGELAARWQHYC